MRSLRIALSWLSRSSRKLAGEQEGAVAVIAAFSMVALIGFVALALDGGLMFVQKTQLQKAVDAAALAAAQDISTGQSSQTDMNTYLGYNGVNTAEVVNAGTGAVTVNDGPCATNGCSGWKVTVQRTFNLSFAPVIGITQATVQATATAIKSPVQAVNSNQLLLYALWAGNLSSDNSNCGGNPCATYSKPVPFAAAPGGLAAGSDVIFSDNQWKKDVVSPNPGGCVLAAVNTWPATSNGKPVCAWNVPSQAGFKGFFNNCNCMVTVNSVAIASQNGNGTGEVDQVCALQGTKSPALFAVVDWATAQGNGPITLHILTLRAAHIDAVHCNNNSAPNYLTAQMAGPGTIITGGVPGGNDPNAPMVLKLWR